MQATTPTPAGPRPPWHPWPGLAAWAAGWATMLWLDGRVDLANLAMLLVLSSAVASLWLPGWAALLMGALAVAGFNWTFVPPRHTFSVDLNQHALLLGAMLLVNAIVTALVLSQRSAAETARSKAGQEARLRDWGDTLRDAADPAAHASALHDALAAASGVPVAVRVLARGPAQPEGAADALQVGQADADQLAGLALCTREARALGPGSGRHEGQPDVYLPLRGRGVALGAAVLCGLGARPAHPDVHPHAHLQALCDQMGLALQRAQAARDEQAAREQAQEQGVRNALLAAISHDYRTPLATIMGAASSLLGQDEKLSAAQRQALAGSIVEEAQRLNRMADNTLQLVRLDSPGVTLRRDWESGEEIVGTVLRRVRSRDPARRVRARLEPALPLLFCDAMLISQLLENLIDNALKFSPEDAPVEVLLTRQGEAVVLAVRDRGPGIAPAWRERVFEVFQRDAPASHAAEASASRTGFGIGLAVCRAIARAHGGELRVRARGRGGCSFECHLPAGPQPPMPAPEA